MEVFGTYINLPLRYDDTTPNMHLPTIKVLCNFILCLDVSHPSDL